MEGLFFTCSLLRATGTLFSSVADLTDRGEIRTWRPGSHVPVSTMRYRTVHVRSSKYRSCTLPISPSVAARLVPFRWLVLLNMLDLLRQRVRAGLDGVSPEHLRKSCAGA